MKNQPQFKVGQRVTTMGYRSLGACERVKGTIKAVKKERGAFFYDVLLETGYRYWLEESLVIPFWNPFPARVRNWKAQN